MNHLALVPTRRDQLASLRPSFPTLDRIRREIEHFSDTSALPSAPEIEEAGHEIARALKPSPDSFAEKCAEHLLSAWPSAKPTPLYVANLVEDLAEFPPDVVAAAAERLRTQCRFGPSPAEYLPVLNELVAERHRLRRQLVLLDRELQRREEERRRREAEERVKRERIERIEAGMRERFGDDAPPPGSYDLAQEAHWRDADRPGLRHWDLCVEWQKALEAGERSALIVCRNGALVRIVMASKIEPARKIEILTAAIRDFASGRQMLEAAITQAGDDASRACPTRASGPRCADSRSASSIASGSRLRSRAPSPTR